MPQTGPNPPSANAVAAAGSVAWDSPANLYSQDAALVSATASSTQTTDKQSYTGFSFSVPGTATIEGVLVEIYDFLGSNWSGSVELTLNGTAVTGTGKTIFTAAGWAEYGHVVDLWGSASLTPAAVNSANFGVLFQGSHLFGAGTLIEVDAIQVTVFYRESSQYGIAAGDISNTGSSGGWDIHPVAGATTLTEALASVPSSQTDFASRHIQVDYLGFGTRSVTAEISVSPLSTPVAGEHVLRCWHVNPVDGDCQVFNGDDDSLVAGFGLLPVADDHDVSWHVQQHVLSGAEVLAINDYANLYFRLYNADDGPSSDGSAAISYVEFIVPEAVPSVPQLASPTATVSAGSWTAVGAATLHEATDETTPGGGGDSDYIESPVATAGGHETKLRLAALVDPAVGTGHIVRYRYAKNTTLGDAVNLVVNLYRADGTTLVATNTISAISAITTGSFTLTGTEADSIPSGDYATGLVIGFKEIRA